MREHRRSISLYPVSAPGSTRIFPSLPVLLKKGGLVAPRLRASNEHIPIVRVPRAGGRPGYPASLLTGLSTGFYNHLTFLVQPADSAHKMVEFTHFNESGRARMVDVSAKDLTERVATAQATVFLQPETLEKIQRGKIAKGDVLSVAQVAGVMGAKKTPDLIPMCHPILLTSVDISFKEESQPNREGRCSITIVATAKTTGPTGVEMEAMTAASVAALTIYDMCKAIDRGMSFSDMCLVTKSGGKSGTYKRS